MAAARARARARPGVDDRRLGRSARRGDGVRGARSRTAAGSPRRRRRRRPAPAARRRGDHVARQEPGVPLGAIDERVAVDVRAPRADPGSRRSDRARSRSRAPSRRAGPARASRSSACSRRSFPRADDRGDRAARARSLDGAAGQMHDVVGSVDRGRVRETEVAVRVEDAHGRRLQHGRAQVDVVERRTRRARARSPPPVKNACSVCAASWTTRSPSIRPGQPRSSSRSLG